MNPNNSFSVSSVSSKVLKDRLWHRQSNLSLDSHQCGTISFGMRNAVLKAIPFLARMSILQGRKQVYMALSEDWSMIQVHHSQPFSMVKLKMQASIRLLDSFIVACFQGVKSYDDVEGFNVLHVVNPTQLHSCFVAGPHIGEYSRRCLPPLSFLNCKRCKWERDGAQVLPRFYSR